MLLNIEQKKGDPQHLNGNVTVYGIIDIDPSDLLTMKHPIASMVHDGLLVAQGNFREQNSLRDFLKSEMGVNVDDEGFGEGLAQMMEKMDGLEGALDPQKLRDRLENMGELEDFIPTPAKVVPFHSVEEVLSQPGDVYFVGYFKNIGNAVLSVNALPITYQARFREQEMQKVRNEIESLIAQIEQSESTPAYEKFTDTENVEEKLLKSFIPNMLYSKADKSSFTQAEKQFRQYMSGYRFTEDLDSIVSLISEKQEFTPKEYKLLELFSKKISLVIREDFSGVEAVRKEIEEVINS
ncbi:hypothetical protein CHISP_1448 [Chitinispirillum alkaliphilum]|nr:hypothetical protein CHISP_1448 [Chitinispirillum alkaliphilum]